MILRTPTALDLPHGSRVAWRYMCHDKFADLLKYGAIFFANASKLTDQYEVTLPEASVQSKRRELVRRGLAKEQVDSELAKYLWARDPDKKLTLLSCWTLRRDESYALWKIYVGKETPGIALRTTVGRLRRSLELGGDSHPEEFYMGQVRYRSYLHDEELTRLHVICTKKPYYDFENELRCFLLFYSTAGAAAAPYDVSLGRRVRVDLTHLLGSIVVSPFAPKGYLADVTSLMRSAGLGERVKASGILDQ